MTTILLVGTTKAQQNSDSSHLHRSSYQPSKKEYFIYGSMLTYGILSIHSPSIQEIDQQVIDLVKPNTDRHTKIDNLLQFTPAVLTVGLESLGVRGEHKPKETILLFGISNVILNTVVTGTKSWSHKLRPNGTSYTSFPSGHTAEAFANAELMRLEYRDCSPWYGVAGYGMAIATGYMRMYNNRHWLGDVLAGAAIGIVSTRTAYWLYEGWRKRKARQHTSSGF